MDLEKDDREKGCGGFPCLFYDEMGNEVGVDQGQRVVYHDPHKRFMDLSNAAPENFNRNVGLDG